MTEQRDGFSQLPEPVRLSQTVTTAEVRTVQPPEGDRHPALWDAQEAGG